MIRIPDKFPPGCSFVANFSGDDFVRFPDGTVFKMSDDGESLIPRSDLPRSGAPTSEEIFLAAAASCRKWAAKSASSKTGA